MKKLIITIGIILSGINLNAQDCYTVTNVENKTENPDLSSKKFTFGVKQITEELVSNKLTLCDGGKPIVVNRTSRHLHGSDGSGWNEFIKNGLGDYGVFVGSEEEHAVFENTLKIKITYHKTNDLLELAQVIQGAEQFIGNQSAALSIAIGLGKTYWCELRADYENTKTPHDGYGDTWFPRVNGFYF